MLGRIGSTARTISVGLMPIGSFAGGALIDLTNGGATLAIMGALLLAVSGIFALVPNLRRARVPRLGTRAAALSGQREPFAGGPDPIATPRPARPPACSAGRALGLGPGPRLPEPRVVRCLPARRPGRAAAPPGAMESNPVAFLARGLEDRLAAARAVVGAFVGADPDDLAFVPNATFGIATALGSLRLGPGDELLATDHEYNAALNALRVAGLDNGAPGRDGPHPAARRRPGRRRGARARGGDGADAPGRCSAT